MGITRWDARTWGRGAVICVGLACSSVLSVSLPAQAQPASRFAWSAELVMPAHASMVRASVPVAVLAGLHSDQGDDLRVVNGSGAMLPFAFVEEKTGQVPTPAPAKVFKGYPLYAPAALAQQTPALRIIERDGERMVELAGASSPASAQAQEAQALRGLLYDTREVSGAVRSLSIRGDFPRNTLLQVSVMSSHDLKNWHLVAQAQPLFQFDENGPVNSRIRLETPLQLQGQYLRLSWDNGASLAEALIELEFEPAVAPLPPQTWPLGTPSKQAEDFMQWSLPSRHAVQALRLQAVGANTLLPVRILTRNSENTPWRWVADTVVYQLADTNVDPTGPAFASMASQSNPSLPLHAALGSQLRIEPANGYTLANNPIQVALDYSPMQVVFVATGEAPFQLLGGADGVQPMRLPLSTVMPGYQAGMENRLPEAQVLAVQGSAQTLQGPGLRQKWWNQRILLWVILGAAVLVLGAIALNVLRATAAPPPDVR
ncbi:DUF3999 family protein [Lampropedia puyangensis]|nr:DUF3999 family protein [Lampropedia puyangensis]